MKNEGVFSEIIKTATDGIESIDGKRRWENKKWQTEPGVFDISLYRGKVIEKSTLTRISIEVKQTISGPGETLKNLASINSLQINIFPSNPLLPVALFNIERRALASGNRLGGYISIFPMKDSDEITGSVKNVFLSTLKKHGKNKTEVLKSYGELWQDLDWQFKGENGIGMKLLYEDSEIQTVKEIITELAKEYFNSVNRTKDAKFNEEDIDRMFSFRFKLAEFILVKDPSTQFCLKKGVPLETLTTMILPPTVRF